ncbi:MAG TPA: ShlB/FhaC/HecB family hemolysin secretion/activation protein [Candidatus Avacidaminococcus intestinavium]|uniref:ShlB/FhaC/HecB family hemolysin secretion/activation protein n=1 Tax=Candidatus Avacidaminococcus intestinavium TaxID=2840684 RepID=A0A9D1MPW4_9FIRM|nr:ShlB/FhaC/HecB family hemolysin secretion/activation protein [Candidatus Avacidaminococcus intestinavium]
MKIKAIVQVLMLLGGMQAVEAADITPQMQEEQLRQARMAQEEREQRLERPTLNIEGAETLKPPEVDEETVSAVFTIKNIIIANQADDFEWLSALSRPHINTNMGLFAINKLVREMNAALLEKGYVTSQIVIPEQNIKEGTLHLTLVIGRVHDVIYSKDSAVVPWRNAFPIRKGDVLSLRALEQGLEQMQRLSSQNVTMKLVPATMAGATDIELTVIRSNPVQTLLSLDDSGLDNTGKIQINATLTLDQLFGSNDIFNFTVNGDGSQDGYQKGMRGRSISYSIPHGKDTFSFQHSSYKHHQTVKSNPYDFLSSGRTNTAKLTWQHLLSRSKTNKVNLDVSISKRDAHSYINDLEILVQRMDTTALEVGISERKYIGNSTLYKRLAHKAGVSWFGAQADNSYGQGPTTRYNQWLFDIDYQTPFMLGTQQVTYTASLHGQWTMRGDRLYGSDMLSIGNRYTVRGFDGNYTLMGESGWYWRNELSFPQSKQSVLYTGLDVGAVYGKSTEILVGKTIAGIAVGARGSFASDVYYDIFVSTPLYKPAGFHTNKFAAGFTLSYRF